MLYPHVSFPAAIQGTNLRAWMHVKVGMPAQVTWSAPDAQPSQCQLVNVSIFGVLVESTAPLPSKDELVTLQFGVVALQGNRK